MPYTPSKVSFNAGELGPFIDARWDIEKYQFGCKTLENWWPKVEGPVDFRPGTHHVGKAKYAHQKVRTEPFIFSDTTRFVLEMGLNYIRFWSNYLSVDTGATISAWAGPGTAYVAGDYVSNGGSNWYCLVDNTSAANFGSDEDEVLTGELESVIGTSVVGDGTLFTSELAVGEWIRTEISPSADHYYGRIVSIETDTTLTIETPFQGLKDDSLAEFGTTYPYRRTRWIEQDTLELYTPYSVSDVFELAVEAINDVVYLAHPDHPLAKLTRLADDIWTYAPVDWDYPPLLSENVTDTTVTPNVKTGTGTLTASTAIFESGHIGSYWGVEHRVKGLSQKIDLIGNNPTTPATDPPTSYREIKGDWSISTVERWVGLLEVVRCDKDDDPTVGANWEIIREFESEANSNIAVSGFQAERAYIGLRYTENGADPYDATYWRNPPLSTPEEPKPYAYLTSDEAYLGGFVKITGITSPTIAVIDVKEKLFSTDATTYWSEGAFSDVRGHPRTVKLFDGRLTLNGHTYDAKGTFQSAVDDFENFKYGTNDADALKFTIAGRRNVIQWAEESQGKLFMGTLGEEIAISGGGFDQSITPTNVKAKTGTSYGSTRLPAVNLNDVLIFVQQGGRCVRELIYDWDQASEGGYKSNDLTRLARHITGDGITDIGVSRSPFPIYWATREDGQLIGLLLERSDNVSSWFRTTSVNRKAGDSNRFDINALFNSVCTIPDNNGNDQVWVAVRRTIDSDIPIQTIEYFDDGEFTDLQSAWRVDQGVRVQLPTYSGQFQITRTRETLSTALGALPTWTPGLDEWVGWSWLCTATDHGLTTGDTIRLWDEVEASMPELSGLVFRVFRVDDDNFYLVDADENSDARVAGITQTAPAAINLSPSFNEFGRVVFITGVLGMTEVNNRKFLLQPQTAVPNSGAYLNNVDATAYTAFTSSATKSIYATPPITPNEDVSSGFSTGKGGFSVVDNFLPTTSVDHLEGEDCVAMVDGQLHTGLEPVYPNNYLKLPDGVYGNDILYGRAYTGTVETQKLDFPMRSGSSRGKIQTMSRIILSLYESWGLYVGTDIDNLEEATYNEPDETMDSTLRGKTKECPVYLTSVKRDPTIVVKQTFPYPATLLALHPKLEVSTDS